ncbi:MAG: cyanophycin synthetase, partial [Chloroflexi bacterium]
IAVDLCQEKPLTNKMLRAVGVPVPAGGIAPSADEAWNIAQAVGLPVVVKPSEGHQGKGVSVHLTMEADVRNAFQIALQQNRGDVLVERFIQGRDHRLLVINGKLAAAARRDPPAVIGDGQYTIAELVEILNQDPRRRPGHSSSLTRIVLDDAVDLTLSQQGMTRESVPDEGQAVKLRTNSNLSTGGTAVDMTDDVHPRNARLAELAAQILALDVAGIDILCHDISRPLAEQDGAIVEVNAAPGLRMHLHPAEGTPRDVGQPIVEMLYPDDSPARIPIIAVTGTNGKTTVTRLISHMVETAHKVVGMTCTDGIYINSELVRKGDSAGPKSAETVLLHPYVEVAVLETARGGILREGLAFDECLVGVVTNVTSDHLGLGGIDTVEEIARVKQVVVEAVEREGAAVLNADDPLVAEMAAATDARVVYFSHDPHNHIVQAHLADNGWCVFVQDNAIVMATGEAQVDLVELDRVPFTLGGKIDFQVANALAAVGAAWAAGLNPAMIGRALTTFQTDTRMVPGRFNVQEINGVELLLDYGHNPAALKALGEAVQVMELRRTIMVITLPGDRRDEDIVASTRATLPYVDAYVLYDSLDLRGRRQDEIPLMMRAALPENIPAQLTRSPRDGILKGWQSAQPGDRLIIILDEVDEALEIIQGIASGTMDAECATPLAADDLDVRPRERVSFPVLSGKRSEA